jgi:hypothetical protein
MPYPADLGTSVGRIVIDNSAPEHDGDTYTLEGVVQPPAAPALAAIYPSTFTIGGPDTLLHCFGTGFAQDDRIVFAGTVERTTFESDGELTTWINSAVWQAPAVVDVLVRTSSGDTAAQQLTIA